MKNEKTKQKHLRKNLKSSKYHKKIQTIPNNLKESKKSKKKTLIVLTVLIILIILMIWFGLQDKI